jgi:hypothetical protein
MTNVFVLCPFLVLTACVTNDALSWSTSPPPALSHDVALSFNAGVFGASCATWKLPFSQDQDLWVSSTSAELTPATPNVFFTIWRRPRDASEMATPMQLFGPLYQCEGGTNGAWVLVGNGPAYDQDCAFPGGSALHLKGGDELLFLAGSPHAPSQPVEAQARIHLNLVQSAIDCAVAADGCVCSTAQFSPKAVGGAVYVWDVLDLVGGATVALDGYPDIKVSADAHGNFQLPIPAGALGKPGALLISGTGDGTPILPTHVYVGPGPSGVVFDGGSTNRVVIPHAFFDGLRSALAAELTAHGDIPAADGASGAAFGAAWNWAWVSLAGAQPSIYPQYSSGALTVSGDGGRCKVFYVHQKATSGGPVNLLVDFGATSNKEGQAVVVCPSTQTTPVVVTATGPVAKIGDGSSAYFSPFTVPMAPGEAVDVEWAPSGL